MGVTSDLSKHECQNAHDRPHALITGEVQETATLFLSPLRAASPHTTEANWPQQEKSGAVQH